MRIGFLTHQYPRARMGGIGAYTLQAALAHASIGDHVHLFTFSLPPDAQIHPQITLHQIPSPDERALTQSLTPQAAQSLTSAGEGIYRLTLAALLSHAASQIPLDIIEAPEVEALGLPLPESIPLITHLHCPTAVAREQNHQTTADTTLEQLEFAALEYADAILAPTQAIINLTQKFLPLPNPKIIPHPFQIPTESPQKPNPLQMLFIGRLETLKGVLTLAQALTQTLKQHPLATFLFIGPDALNPAGRSMQSQLQQILQSANVLHQVQFLGQQPPEKIALAIQTSAFTVLPSQRENFSHALCESMSRARTSIVADNTGSVELLANTGTIVPQNNPPALANAMSHLLSNPAEAQNLGHFAQARIHSLCNPQKIALQRQAFFQKVITEKPPAKIITPRLSLTKPLLHLTRSLLNLPNPNPQSPGHRLLSLMQQISQSQGPSTQILLYGAGKHTARLLTERHTWESHGHHLTSIIDDHPRFAQNGRYLDLPVQPLQNLLNHPNPNVAVVLSTDTYQDQFWSNTQPLRDHGVPVFRLYT